MATPQIRDHQQSQDVIEQVNPIPAQPSYPVQGYPTHPAQSQPFYIVQPAYLTPPVRPSYSQGSQQSQYAYSTAHPTPAYISQYRPANMSQASQPKPKPKPKQKYYKPAATETFVLSLFFLATLVFIGGIEFILRRGIPVTTDLTNSANNTTIRPQKLLSKLVGTEPNGFENELGYGLNLQPEQPMSCIGIEMIVSKVVGDQCDTLSPICSSTATYTKPIYNKAIPTMPCYACAMQAQGIQARGFITATTTHCGTCKTTSPATIYPCSTCKGTILSNAPQWQVTPTEPPRLYTEYSTEMHSHTKTT